MKLIVIADKDRESDFQQAGVQCGHTITFMEQIPTAEETAACCPEAAVLMIPKPAALLQDYLAILHQICPVCPLLVFEQQSDGTCFFVTSISGEKMLRDFFYAAAESDQLIQLRYPEVNWERRFPDAFHSQKKREVTKSMLYGITASEFAKAKVRYGLHINESAFYLFMWELNKKALVNYGENQSIHFFLHALRLEDFSRALNENLGGEIIFTDISFAYILVNAAGMDRVRMRRIQEETLASALAQVAGRNSSQCFISDLLHSPEEICNGHQDFKKTCAYRFFCREATAISNDYIRTHQRWFGREEIQKAIESVQYYLSYDIGNSRLPNLIRHLYLDMVKPSMNYRLYYFVNESILKSLKEELSVKLLMEALDSPWLMLLTQLGSVEESCARVLECISTLASQQIKTKNISNRLVNQAIHYLEERYAEPLTVGEIARHLNISSSYLSQCFKKETGVSMKRYLTMRRMQRAKQLLLTTDDSVISVALAVGYDDYRQFSKMFKVYTGVTPAQCRKGLM